MKRLILLAAGLMIVLFAITTQVMARYWTDERTLAEFLVRHHPYSARSHAMLAEVLLRDVATNPLAAVTQYHTAAKLAPSEAAYLIRLVSIIGLIHAQVDIDTPLNIPLVLDISSDQRALLHLQKDGRAVQLVIDDSVFSEIARRLSTEPLNGQTESALAKLTDCAVEHPDQCDQLRPRLIEWLIRSLDNPRSNNSIRKALWMQLTRLQLERGDFPAALESAQRARTIDPFNASLAIMEANIRLLAGQKDAASGILAWLGNRPLNSFQRDQVVTLNQMLKAAP